MKIIQELPFSIVISRDDATSSRLLATRVRAFNRHAHPFKNSEYFQSTLKADSALLLSAELKTSGESVGSVRIESNATERFYFENEVTTDDLEKKIVSICASRLSATEGPLGKVVKLALAKAFYLYAHANQCAFVYGFVDKPRLRLYRNLGFEPALEGNPNLSLKCHDYLPMQLVRSEVGSFQTRLLDSDKALAEFMFDTRHPDIKVFSSVGSLSQTRRRSDQLEGSPLSTRQLLPTPSV
jgi:hypothetical protein